MRAEAVRAAGRDPMLSCGGEGGGGERGGQRQTQRTQASAAPLRHQGALQAAAIPGACTRLGDL